MIKDNGGGICQDTSTLFQAVLQAHLPIVERHTHSLPVSYVLKGQDATVSFGILDFRFRNDTQGYLFISGRTGSNWLRIQLFGLADDSHPLLQKPNGFPSYPEDWYKDPKSVSYTHLRAHETRHELVCRLLLEKKKKKNNRNKQKNDNNRKKKKQTKIKKKQ